MEVKTAKFAIMAMFKGQTDSLTNRKYGCIAYLKKME